MSDAATTIHSQRASPLPAARSAITGNSTLNIISTPIDQSGTSNGGPKLLGTSVKASVSSKMASVSHDRVMPWVAASAETVTAAT